MNRFKGILIWLTRWETISIALLGVSIGLHIKQERWNNAQIKLDRQFYEHHVIQEEIREANWKLDSTQSERIIELFKNI